MSKNTFYNWYYRYKEDGKDPNSSGAYSETERDKFVDIAILNTGMKAPKRNKPRLLSDNDPCYISKELAEYMDTQEMDHIHGRPALDNG